MLPFVAKFLHQVNAIPGVRFRFWEEHRCSRHDFKDLSDPDLRLRSLDRDELPLIQAVHPATMSPQALADRLERGNECWIIEQDGVPAYRQWAIVNHTEQPLDLAQVSRGPKGLSLPPRAVYLWDAYCAIAYRRRGLNRKAKCSILAHWFERSVEQAALIVEPFNIANLRSIAPIGFTFRRTFIEFKLGRTPDG